MTTKRPAKASPELWRKLKPLARQMRQAPTYAENLLWQSIRRKALDCRFRRQHAIDRFIVDFYVPEIRLVIEVDGNIHDYSETEDAIRQQYLEEVYEVVFLRFSNGEVIQQMESVLERIGEKVIELKA